MTVILNRYEDALRSIPAPGGGCHTALLGVANLGVMSGLSDAQMLADILASIPEGGRRVSEREILAAIKRSRTDTQPFDGSSNNWSPAIQTKSVRRIKPEFLTSLIRKGDGAEEVDFWEASPVRLYDEPEADAGLLLNTLYNPDDFLFLGDTYSTEVKTAREWLPMLKSGLDRYPHIIPNPLTGGRAETKSGGMSYRCDSAVEEYRFALVEFDNLSRADQLAFWATVALPVAALIDTGGKSIHGWIRTSGVSTATDWDKLIRKGLYDERLIPCGVDPACRNESRLSRLPGHHRKEKDRIQRLLYLNPDPLIKKEGILL